LHGTLLKSDRQLLGSFQKSFVKIWEMYQPIGRKGLKFKREEVHAFLSSKEFCKLKSIDVQWLINSIQCQRDS
jgi:hypothetical protein